MGLFAEEIVSKLISGKNGWYVIPFVKNLVTDRFSNSAKSTIWNEISHDLWDDIPIVSFLLKLFKAYPKADRHLNLEVFVDKIMIEELNEDCCMEKMELKEKRYQIMSSGRSADCQKYASVLRNIIYKFIDVPFSLQS
jgi:hypothetical protein